MVQNGKFSAGTDRFVNALKSVDFPTLGKPTIPIDSDMAELFCLSAESVHQPVPSVAPPFGRVFTRAKRRDVDR